MNDRFYAEGLRATIKRVKRVRDANIAVLNANYSTESGRKYDLTFETPVRPSAIPIPGQTLEIVVVLDSRSIPRSNFVYSAICMDGPKSHNGKNSMAERTFFYAEFDSRALAEKMDPILRYSARQKTEETLFGHKFELEKPKKKRKKS